MEAARLRMRLGGIRRIALNSNMFDAATIDQVALERGFQRKGKANWTRRTEDFVQLVNIQRSTWSSDQSYVNFALWPRALGEPKTIAESKFMFRTRAEDLGAGDVNMLFDAADRLQSLANLQTALDTRAVSGLVSVELQRLLSDVPRDATRPDNEFTA
jgi:hypothetical protein